MPIAYSLNLASFQELLQRVLADCLKALKVRLACRLLDEHQRLVGQAGEQLQNIVRGDVTTCADGFGGVQRTPACEDRHAAKQRTFRLAQQVVTPVDEGAQRLLPRQSRPAAAGQQVEAVVQAGSDLFRGQHPDARCCELQSQRDAVELLADTGNRGRVLLVQQECRLDGACPLDEKTDGLDFVQRF